jgi:hypothetical protein
VYVGTLFGTPIADPEILYYYKISELVERYPGTLPDEWERQSPLWIEILHARMRTDAAIARIRDQQKKAR